MMVDMVGRFLVRERVRRRVDEMGDGVMVQLIKLCRVHSEIRCLTSLEMCQAYVLLFWA
jgi:hypothetical protein